MIELMPTSPSVSLMLELSAGGSTSKENIFFFFLQLYDRRIFLKNRQSVRPMDYFFFPSQYKMNSDK